MGMWTVERQLAVIFLFFARLSASFFFDKAECVGDDESLPLYNEEVFDIDCQQITSQGDLSLGHLSNPFEPQTLLANVTYECYDFTGELVRKRIRDTIEFSNGQYPLVWGYNSNEPSFYYGVSCYVIGCFKELDTDKYYRFANATCETYHVYDECSNSAHNCHPNAACHNIENGTFYCTCNSQFVGNGTYCEDLDECTSGRHNCDVNAICNNTIGSYFCTCKDGYNGSDGTVCEDLNECASGRHNCDVNANCNNTIGSYLCTCKDGYSGSNGTDCEDIDECNMSGVCSELEYCENTPGSFECHCILGYMKIGSTCEAITKPNVVVLIVLVLLTTAIILTLTTVASMILVWCRKLEAKKSWSKIHHDGLTSKLDEEKGKEISFYDEIFKPVKLHFEEDEISLQHHLSLASNTTKEFKKDDFKHRLSDSSAETSEGYISHSYTSSNTSHYIADSEGVELEEEIIGHKDISNDSVSDLTRDFIEEPCNIVEIREPDSSLHGYILQKDPFPALNSTDYVSTKAETTTAVDRIYHDEFDILYDSGGSSGCTGYVSNGAWPEDVVKESSIYSMSSGLSINLDTIEPQERIASTSDYIQT